MLNNTNNFKILFKKLSASTDLNLPKAYSNFNKRQILKYYSNKTKEEIVTKIHKNNINTVTLVKTLNIFKNLFQF